MSRVKFSSRPNDIKGDLPIGANLSGQTFEFVSIDVTQTDYMKPNFQPWLLEAVFPRLAPSGTIMINILAQSVSSPAQETTRTRAKKVK